MLLTDYFRSEHTLAWDYAKQCGVNHAVIRMPEDDAFDITDFSHWKAVHKRFTDFGVKPVIIEPLPNELHDHIKMGDERRDECIEKVIQMFSYMDELDIRTICFNFVVYLNWIRTASDIKERGGAYVTGFDLKDFAVPDFKISHQELWDNYEYFLKAVLPHAEKHNITLALHPDDPPLSKLGEVSRILTSADCFEKAMNLVPSDNLGITMCQATFYMMGEDLYEVIPRFKDKIKFIHFRNTVGHKECFRETFHDNGALDMADLMRLYHKCGIDVPIRVDHVPTMAGENIENPGYDTLGRLFAIGYLKGILDSVTQ